MSYGTKIIYANWNLVENAANLKPSVHILLEFIHESNRELKIGIIYAVALFGATAQSWVYGSKKE